MINDLDALAKKMGFKDAAMMVAYQNKQREQMSAPARVGQPGGAASPSPLANATMSWHPAILLKSVLDRISQVLP